MSFRDMVLLIVLMGGLLPARGQKQTMTQEFAPVRAPEWVRRVSRMTYLTPGELDRAVKAGAEVVHFNLVWPYYPLKRDGGDLNKTEAEQLRSFVEQCHKKGVKAVLGLPPFPSVAHVKAHPDWRIDPDGSGKALTVEAQENNLGTRLGCNVGPWGDYLIELLAELTRDYKLDGFSFDGNYHSSICYCAHCKARYKQDAGRDIPPKADLDDVAYRQYLVWRGERLEDHYRKMQQRIKAINPEAVIITWTVNAGRYGHFLYSPRAMPTRLNRLLDMPMMEWWLDETNLGGSIVPAFGAAYLRAVAGDGPCAAEPYMMSRGNPYGTHSFPALERKFRALLTLTHGNISAESLGWPGHADSAADVFREVAARAKWITNTRKEPWAAMLVSEQTRQFYAYKNIAERYLPHLFGGFRAAMEEHLALDLINDWDLTPQSLARYRVLFLPNAAALSDAQGTAIRAYVQNGGGLVATCDTSLCDELGRPRKDFALTDLFGASYAGPLQSDTKARPQLDVNFAIHLDETYWQQRVGVATLTYQSHPLLDDARLNALVPHKSVIFRGAALRVKPHSDSTVIGHLTPEGEGQSAQPSVLVRNVGKGRVVYLAAGIDAALWSYAFPYQRRLLNRALEWAAGERFPITVDAPMVVQTTFFRQEDSAGKRLIIHLWNGINSTANHGLPAMDVPLREEVVPVHGIRVTFDGLPIRRVHLEPGGKTLSLKRDGRRLRVTVPSLDIHAIVVVELN
jgi:hypothetical protein